MAFYEDIYSVKLHDPKISDIKLIKLGAESKNSKIKIAAYYKNGIKEYFDPATGWLEKIVNKNGNEIKFEYKINKDNAHKLGEITITDTYKNNVTIKYTTQYVSLKSPNKEVKYIMKDKFVTERREICIIDGKEKEFITSFENQENYFYDINYYFYSAQFGLFTLTSNKFTQDDNKIFQYIKKITFPNGRISNYNYEFVEEVGMRDKKYKGNMFSGEWNNKIEYKYYRVKESFDNNEANKQNWKEYIYSLPHYLRAGNICTDDTEYNNNIDTFKFTTTVTTNNDKNKTKETFTYNSKGLLESDELRAIDGTPDGKLLKKVLCYSFFKDLLPLAVTTYQYSALNNSNYISTNVEKAYDEYGNIIFENINNYSQTAFWYYYSDDNFIYDIPAVVRKYNENGATDKTKNDDRSKADKKNSKPIPVEEKNTIQQIDYTLDSSGKNIGKTVITGKNLMTSTPITADYLYYTDGRLKETSINSDGKNKKTSYIYTSDAEKKEETIEETINVSNFGKKENIPYKTTYNVDFTTGLLKTQTTPDGNVTKYAYDNLGRLENLKNPGEDKGTDYSYFIDEDILNFSEFANSEIASYLSKLRLIGEISIRGSITVENQKEGLKEYKKYEVFNCYGKPIMSLEKVDGVLKFKGGCAYNSFQQLVKSIDAKGNIISNEYEILGRLSKTTFPTVSKYNQSSDVEIEYDDAYDLLNAGVYTPKKVVKYDGHSKASYYDCYGRLTTEVYEDGNTAAGWKKARHYDYDNMNNIIQERHKDVTKNYDFDAVGRLKTMEICKKYNLEKDNKNKSVSKMEYYFLDNISQTTIEEYTAGKLVDTKKSKSQEYDELGRLTKEYSNRDKNLFTEYNYNYDGFNQTMIKYESGKRLINLYEYGRLKSIYKLGNGQKKLLQDNIYSSQGNLTNIKGLNNKDEMQEQILTYYPDLRLKSILYPFSEKKEVSYTYDLNGNKESVTDTFGKKISYSYDEKNRLTNISYNDKNDKNISYEYYPDDMIRKVTYPNSMAKEFTYDKNDNDLKTITINELTYTYSFDDEGNVLNVIEDNTKDATKKMEYTYQYDYLGRMTSVEDKESSIPKRLTTYTFDAIGNILSQKKESIQDKTFSEISRFDYDEDNRVKNMYQATRTITDKKLRASNNQLGYSYDVDGNLVQTIKNGKELFTYEYDDLSRLTKVLNNTEYPYTVGEYDYYPNGLRSSKKVDTLYSYNYFYDGDKIINEITPKNLNAKDEITNIFGIDGISSRISKLEGEYFFVNNGHGDVKRVYGVDGNTKEEYTYNEYGKETKKNNGLKNPFRYSGEYFDEESGLIYLRARYYSPDMMRFLSEDSYGGSVGAPLSRNLYAYCQGNPVMYTDPSGHTPGGTGEEYLPIRSDGSTATVDNSWLSDSISEARSVEEGHEALGMHLAEDLQVYSAKDYVETGSIRSYIIGVLSTLWTPDYAGITFTSVLPWGAIGKGAGLIGEAAMYGGKANVGEVASVVEHLMANNMKLPSNYITKSQARDLGLKKGKFVSDVAPGKSIGGDVFKNDKQLLPTGPGRIYYEADIGYKGGYRGNMRLVYSNDGAIYISEHYETFKPLNPR